MRDEMYSFNDQINVATWNKEFNDRTAPFEQGVPIPTRTYVNEDKSYRLVLYHPPLPTLVKKAAGITRGAMDPHHETAGLISLKHVYHIAEMKRQVCCSVLTFISYNKLAHKSQQDNVASIYLQDDDMDKYSLKEVCLQVIRSANQAGIKVVDHLSADEIRRLQTVRGPIVEEQRQEIEDKKASKFLRSGVEDRRKNR